MCNICRRTRGSQCTRFEVHTVARREDIYNLLLLVCYMLQGGCIVGSYNNILIIGLVHRYVTGVGKVYYLTISQGTYGNLQCV